MSYRKFEFAPHQTVGYLMNFNGDVMNNMYDSGLGRFNFKKLRGLANIRKLAQLKKIGALAKFAVPGLAITGGVIGAAALIRKRNKKKKAARIKRQAVAAAAVSPTREVVVPQPAPEVTRPMPAPVSQAIEQVRQEAAQAVQEEIPAPAPVIQPIAQAESNKAAIQAIQEMPAPAQAALAQEIADRVEEPMRVKSEAGNGYPGFVNWVAEEHPEVVEQAIADDPQVAEDLQGLGVLLPNIDLSQAKKTSVPIVDISKIPKVSTTSSLFDPEKWKSVGTSIAQAGSALMPLYQQQQIMKLQLERAKQGLPPLDTSALTAESGMQVGINPATRNTILMVAGLAVGGLLLFKFMGKKR